MLGFQGWNNYVFDFPIFSFHSLICRKLSFMRWLISLSGSDIMTGSLISFFKTGFSLHVCHSSACFVGYTVWLLLGDKIVCHSFQGKLLPILKTNNAVI